MPKPLLLIATIIMTILLVPVVSYAHSTLEGSTPASGETVNYSVDVLTLKFNTPIKDGSTVTLTSDKGEDIEVGSVSIQENNMLVQLSETLPSGVYTVHYEIVGGDTHIVDGDYTFTVKANSAEQKNGEENEPKPEAEEPSSEQSTEDDTNEKNAAEKSSNAQNVPSEQPEEDGGLSGSMIAIATVLIAIGLGFIWWVMRKKGSE
ncbi:copper resistance CopC family protein [Pseudalkalibacillus decolorationis]|uniref:copper resistance CopC family protein n=1 Tax=Pseudalkalibacillus decolorationis TaxID=163879 RepID=UPI0021480316|nr:copper resistance protein CopC [Pseudalkalibacillus decolorationis]